MSTEKVTRPGPAGVHDARSEHTDNRPDAEIADRVREAVASAPPLTGAQRRYIADLLADTHHG